VKPWEIFWTSICLLVVLALTGCPIQQKGVGPAPQQERERPERTE